MLILGKIKLSPISKASLHSSKKEKVCPYLLANKKL